jgi:hypothetical protein
MGQKVHPESMRVGYIHDWKSNWYSERNFADYLAEDVQIRDHINAKLEHAGLSRSTSTRPVRGSSSGSPGRRSTRCVATSTG